MPGSPLDSHSFCPAAELIGPSTPIHTPPSNANSLPLVFRVKSAFYASEVEVVTLEQQDGGRQTGRGGVATTARQPGTRTFHADTTIGVCGYRCGSELGQAQVWKRRPPSMGAKSLCQSKDSDVKSNHHRLSGRASVRNNHGLEQAASQAGCRNSPVHSNSSKALALENAERCNRKLEPEGPSNPEASWTL